MIHIPVLLEEVLEGLNLHEGDTVLDGTINGGGHAEEVAKRIGKRGVLIGLDRDKEALARARTRLENVPCKVALHEADFRNLDRALKEDGSTCVNAILLDLGLSSDQLETSGRGFSFQKDEPLLMTFTATPHENDLSAREILNTWEEENIRDILHGYGEEKFARAIARTIVSLREEHPFERTTDLVNAVERAVPAWYRHARIHPATKTFQALRIVVNDEIEGLSEGLTKAYENICIGGRIAVVSFHSIEDRTVKRFFRKLASEEKGTVLTKKPMRPTAKEIHDNPRARSARLRIFEKHNP